MMSDTPHSIARRPYRATKTRAMTSITLMTNRQIFRNAALVAATQAALACSRFVFHEDPFTPDPAPVSETLVAGGDTTYVLTAPSYYLLSSKREALWNRQVMEDVAWRY